VAARLAATVTAAAIPRRHKQARLCQPEGLAGRRVNKPAVVAQILQQLKAELALFKASAQATHAEATHEENKAEDKYDTRGLEASYLAMGQLKQAEEAQQAVQTFEALNVRAFAPGEMISLGALVVLEGRDRSSYFIGPRAGGTEIEIEGQSVLVITPQSPLGRQLMGRQQGDALELDLGGRRNPARVVSVV
jgi:transcription elongation GreA/GreB family factor